MERKNGFREVREGREDYAVLETEVIDADDFSKLESATTAQFSQPSRLKRAYKLHFDKASTSPGCAALHRPPDPTALIADSLTPQALHLPLHLHYRGAYAHRVALAHTGCC